MEKYKKRLNKKAYLVEDVVYIKNTSTNYPDVDDLNKHQSKLFEVLFNLSKSKTDFVKIKVNSLIGRLNFNDVVKLKDVYNLFDKLKKKNYISPVNEKEDYYIIN